MKIKKKYLIISISIISIVILLQLASIFKNNKSKIKEEYSCLNLNGNITIEYLEDNEKIRLTDNRGKVKILNSSLSGSGEEYKGENNIFHTNGKDAIFGINDVEYTCSKIVK